MTNEELKDAIKYCAKKEQRYRSEIDGRLRVFYTYSSLRLQLEYQLEQQLKQLHDQDSFSNSEFHSPKDNR